MFSHPVSKFGYLCIVLGVLLILLSNGASFDAASGLYLLGVGLLGFSPFLILLGVIAQGFLRIERYLSGVPAMQAAFNASSAMQANEPGGDPNEPGIDPAERLRRRMMKSR
jgi:hypothetical protein